MEIVIVSIMFLITVLAVIYALRSPHCPKHKFTRMDVVDHRRTTVLDHSQENSREETKYRCPFCGRTFTLIHEETSI